MKYNKNPESLEKCCEILTKRGLQINDGEKAITYLKHLGYFRLTGYMFHLQSKDGLHKFTKNTKFEDIISIYEFDKKLRNIISDYLQRIEICLSTNLTDKYSIEYGFFGIAK